MLDHIFARYDAVLVLDTETTGISCRKDEIIELAVLKAGQDEAGLCELETMDEFVRLSEGRHLPDKIVELTGITERMLLDDGISKRQAAEMFSRMFGERIPRSSICACCIMFLRSSAWRMCSGARRC